MSREVHCRFDDENTDHRVSQGLGYQIGKRQERAMGMEPGQLDSRPIDEDRLYEEE